jgi:hypothetical protein
MEDKDMECKRIVLAFVTLLAVMLFCPGRVLAAEVGDDGYVYVHSNQDAYDYVVNEFLGMQEEPIQLRFSPSEVDSAYVISAFKNTFHINEIGIYNYNQLIYDGFTCSYGANEIWFQFRWKLTNQQEQMFDATVAMLAPYLVGATQYDTIKNVHDWICMVTEYDDATLAGLADRHTGYNALFEGLAVCDGYATLFQKFMDKLGIPCYCITGNNHAWNLVYVDGAWYNVDCTWDDQSYGIIYKYFMY